MKRYKVIYNPSSGKEEAANRAFQMSKLVMNKNDVEFTFYATKGKNDAMNKAIESCNEGYDMIISCGGDGTVHEIVNGLMKCKNRPNLAILPAGTINDFAEQLHIPKTAEKFAKMFNSLKFKEVDVGKINDDYFINVVSGGIFTNIPHTVSIDEKTLFGRYAYYFHAFLEIPEQLMKTYKIKFTIDDNVYDLDTHLFLINNTPGAGGFKCLSPNAKFDDGLLDVVIFEKASYTDLMQIFTGVFNGQHVKHPKVKYFQANDIVIESLDKKLVVDVDGELGGNMPIHISSENKALKILVP